MIVGVAQYALYTGLKGEKMPVAPLDAPEGNWSDPEDEKLAQTMYLSFIEIQNAVVPDGARAILCEFALTLKALISLPVKADVPLLHRLTEVLYIARVPKTWWWKAIAGVGNRVG